MPLGNAHGKHIVTIEGINQPGTLNPVQQAMSDCGATQCGFCTPGFVMSLTGFCLEDANARPENAIAAIDGNICRCTGYKSIERATVQLVNSLKNKKPGKTIPFLVSNKFLPEYFTDIANRLSALQTALQTGQAIEPASQPTRPHLIGGGTDLYVQKHDEMTNAPARFVLNQPKHNDIRREGNRCTIGASATVTDLKKSNIISEIFPSFNRYAKLISSTQIRNMATVAGNFINASPIGDLTIFFLALDAQLVISDGAHERELPLRKLYIGYKHLDKKPDEQILRIWFNIPGKNTHFHFEKVSKRQHLDIASVNTAALFTSEGKRIVDAAISAGGVGPVPMYLHQTSAYLNGKMINKENIEAAIVIMKKEIAPISDARGSKEYKTLLLSQLIKAHFVETNFLQPVAMP